MSFSYTPPAPPVNGGSSAFTDSDMISQSEQANNNVNETMIYDSSSSSSSVSSSLVVLIIIISSAIFVTASIYIFLNCFYRRSRRTFDASEGFVSQNHGNNRHVASKTGGGLHVSLPLFKFGSLTGNLTSGDCAVCLSKFDREDQLRLLPLCCHAFHASCIDTWLSTNKTCPLCRSSVNPTEADVLNKIHSVPDNTAHRSSGGGGGGGGAGIDNTNSGSFRIEIGNISARRGAPDIAGDGRRSYSVGSFEYIVDQGYEVPVEYTHQRTVSVKEFVDVTVTEPPREILAAGVAGAGERSWLKDYVDWLAPVALWSRTTSLRSSRRNMSGSIRRNDVVVVPVEDLEANRLGEEISELFRWLSGV